MKPSKFFLNFLGFSHKSFIFTLTRRNYHRCGVVALVITLFLVAIVHHIFFKPLVPWTKVEWKDQDFQDSRGVDDDEIIILKWTKYWQTYWGDSPLLFKAKQKCPGAFSSKTLPVDCRISFDRRYLHQSHAVIFHLWDLKFGMRFGEEMPPYHDPKQIWIYQNQESPDYENVGPWMRSSLKGLFNWTMTYRKDSDYYDPYGRVVPRETPLQENPEIQRNHARNKTKLVAWIVSHCETPAKREEYVEELRLHIPVDIFGRCGTFQCKPGSFGGCYADIAQDYKFYLSFENALCVDYVTEKFFHALAQNIVPVVYGGANYSEIAPAGGYIDAREFASPKALADYLLYLDENMEEYLRYFQWKEKFRVVSRMGGDPEGDEGRWCALCYKVAEEIRRTKEQNSLMSPGTLTQKWYEDVQNWWNFRGGRHNDQEKIPACQRPIIPSKF